MKCVAQLRRAELPRGEYKRPRILVPSAPYAQAPVLQPHVWKHIRRLLQRCSLKESRMDTRSIGSNRKSENIIEEFGLFNTSGSRAQFEKVLQCSNTATRLGITFLLDVGIGQRHVTFADTTKHRRCVFSDFLKAATEPQNL